jgi:hypothetical protein
MRTQLNRAGLSAALLVAFAVLSAHPAVAQKEEIVEIASRNQRVRALLLIPAQPAGSAILLAGGHGNLALGKDGSIGWGAGNQLVRTRAAYRKAGFATLVPDIAPDLKHGSGGVARYRWSERYARDIGAFIAHMRSIAEPVYLIGTSRAALSVAKAKHLFGGAKAVDIVLLQGGSAGSGDPCEARSHHGFAGQDAEVVKMVTDWLRKR